MRAIARSSRNTTLNDAQSIQVASLLLAIHQNDAAINLIQQLSKRPALAEAAWLQFDQALVYLLAGSDEKAVELARAYMSLCPKECQSLLKLHGLGL